MGLDRTAVEDLGRVVAWSEGALEYARERGQRRLTWLLEAVRAELELERALLSLPAGEHPRPWRDGVSLTGGGGDAGESAAAEEVLGRRKAKEKSRLRLAAWESFMRDELRELELRRDGQLARLLAGASPGETPEALRRLADEDRRQAEEGLVALMSNGRVCYKRVDELCEGDMPARIAASRTRTTWLKERRDGWLPHGPGSRGGL